MPHHGTRRRLLRSAAALLVLLVAGASFASWYNAFHRRFAPSRPALDAYAVQVIAAGPAAPLTPPAALGSFAASDAFRLPHGFAFRADFGHPFDWNGLAYSVEPLPERMPDSRPPFQTMAFEPVQGNWYKVWRN